MALNAIAIDVMLPALPYMGTGLGVTDENDRQLVVSAYMIGFGAAQIVFGPIADRYGRRAPLFFGIALYVVCALLADFRANLRDAARPPLRAGPRRCGDPRRRHVGHPRPLLGTRDGLGDVAGLHDVHGASRSSRPALARSILFAFTWHYIFLFMTCSPAVIGAVGLVPAARDAAPRISAAARSCGVIAEGFRAVFTNRSAISYGLAGMFLFRRHVRVHHLHAADLRRDLWARRRCSPWRSPRWRR